ncbi:MAG: cytochrome P450 [Verrucomicrobia bacterium]|nr:cytochrome P450 [Verrucomicrobiota bacterium]
MNLDFDLNAPEVHQRPFETYRRLREVDPVHWSERYQSWFLTRHSDVHAALRHPSLTSKRLETFRRLTPPERSAEVAEAFRTLERWVLFQDGPDHVRKRQLFGHGFTARALESLLPRIETVAGDLLDALAGRPSFDAAADLAIPFPVTVIADLFGVAVEDRPKVAHWSDDIAQFLTSVPIPAAACDRIVPTLRGFAATMSAVVESRRRQPRGDFLDELIHAEDEGGRIEPADLLANFSLLLFAGNETTRNLIGNGIVLLLAHPEAREALRQEPDLWRNAVDEILRVRSPVQIISREVAQPLTLGGRDLKAGQQVFCVLGAANHDPEVFPDPERFDIRRNNADDHLAFGGGAHFCLGHALAHAEGRVALQRLFEAFPGLHLDPDHPTELLGTARLMGFTRLPVCTARSGEDVRAS